MNPFNSFKVVFMDLQLSCECGSVQGILHNITKSTERFVCYCDDCQSFAKKLGKENVILDVNGGSEIIPVYISDVEITKGENQLKYLKITDRGPKRWYADCCKTPVGNTGQGKKNVYLGLLHNFIKANENERMKILGPIHWRVMGKFGHGDMPTATHKEFPKSLIFFTILPFMVKGRMLKKYQTKVFK